MRSVVALLTGTPRASVKISLDSDYVFVSGQGKEAQGQYLRGAVALTLAQGECVRNKQVKLILTKNISIGHHGKDKRERIEMHCWESFCIRAGQHPIQSSSRRDTYEWPFELFVPGTWDETFRGCRRCTVGYRLEASVSSSPGGGGTGCDESACVASTFAPLRVIRCPTVSSYDLLDPAAAQGKWAADAEYNVSIRHQAIAVGGLIPVDAQLAIAEEGVEVKKAGFCLHETHVVHDEEAPDVTIFYGQRLVQDWELETDGGNKRLYSWQQCLSLPRIVSRCSPDCSLRGMSITHTLHFRATLVKNGEESTYSTSIPVTLVISPELPITGWDMFAPVDDNMVQEVMDALADGIQIPPKYCASDYSASEYECYPDTPPPGFDQALSPYGGGCVREDMELAKKVSMLLQSGHCRFAA